MRAGVGAGLLRAVFSGGWRSGFDGVRAAPFFFTKDGEGSRGGPWREKRFGRGRGARRNGVEGGGKAKSKKSACILFGEFAIIPPVHRSGGEMAYTHA